MLSRLTAAISPRVALLAAAACLAVGLGASAAEPPSEATPDKPTKSKAHPVTVTQEMIGAGIVSIRRGAAATAAGDGHARPPGAVLARAAALADHHRRPAQQPPAGSHARQAHRLGVPFAAPENLPRQRRRELLARRQHAGGQRRGQFRYPFRRLRHPPPGLDLWRLGRARQRARIAELPRRCPAAAGRAADGGRYPQLPPAVHRPEDLEDADRVGQARRLQARAAGQLRASPTTSTTTTTAISW